ncbi:MAG: MFS transporter [Ruminococcus sp.]|nr:MFS transporter [Ruminococcus sp.]
MKTLKELKNFIILWLTQSFSSLGSSMTSFALIIMLYQDSGSALTTALLSVSSYAPYVIMSIFSGAISDKWNKKTIMLVCDSFAALCTVITLILLKNGSLEIWHLYILNALNGLMNSVQSPASDVAVTLLTPEKHYQKTGGLRYFSNSLVSILTPVISAAVMAFAGIEAVIMFDLLTFAAAFFSLLIFIRIPKIKQDSEKNESILQLAKSGLVYLKNNRGILFLIIFLSGINLIASICSATMPALVLSKADEAAYGIVNSCVGVFTLLGSVIATIYPEPKSRIKVICNCLLLSMSVENFAFALGNNTVIWCIGSFFGWIAIPLMSANYDVIFRSNVPKEMQGRVYSVRNTLQFFTIPLGYFSGGFLVDKVFEPLMAATDISLLKNLFGTGKGSGAAIMFFIIGVSGVLWCLIFRRVKALRELE